MGVLDTQVDDILSWLDSTEPVRPAINVESAKTNTLTSTTTASLCFEINRDVLLHMLEKAIIVVPSRDMIPVLTNFQFKLFDNRLEVVTSSGQMSLVVETNQVDSKITGVEVFPAKLVYNIIREASVGSTVYVEVNSAGAVIVAGNYSTEIQLYNGKDFPKMDDLSAVTFYSIDRNNFSKAISAVKYALPNREFSGQDSMRMISVKNGKFTACDGARFHQVRLDDFDLSMQLAGPSITTLLKVLSFTDQELIEVGETKDKLVFKLNNVLLFINKMNDPYPNVEQLWLRPALNNDLELLVNKAELITAIKQVKVTVDANSINIGLSIESDKMQVVAKGINKSASTTIPCKWAGKPRNIVVNYIHLAEMLKSYSPNECRFLLDEESKTYKAPILLKDDESSSLATIAQRSAYLAGLT